MSSSYSRYSNVIQATYIFLSRSSLYELEIIQARGIATNHLKNKEYSKKSLYKDKSLIGTEALKILISKQYKETNEAVKKAKHMIQIFENKRKGELKA